MTDKIDVSKLDADVIKRALAAAAKYDKSLERGRKHYYKARDTKRDIYERAHNCTCGAFDGVDIPDVKS